MSSLQNIDLHNCLSTQPRKSRPATSKATQELAAELLDLVNHDRNKAMGIIKQIMYYSPDKSIEWYCEQAISKLNKRPYSTSK